ncbi:MFS transporter [Corynebacterium kefirresidentii]|uniref:MFS transporter n=1 Tax=Corynebacterium kefirresidentii TaxID=1979527 RepID=UPI00190434F2|nr:MFS transporter [Corynebacterium kefirresidentii]MCK6083000.1 MFS transporter [Corynebacterium kefirresidentii]QQN48366.1 MFS transporter [Corynebacterium kefirresidentii]
MPITKPVLTLYGGLLLAWFIMLGVQVSGGGGFLLPLIASTLATLAHVGLGIWWIAQKVRGNPRANGGAIAAGIIALLAGASWASWVLVAWDDFRASMALPAINIAGLPAFILTPLTIALCVGAAIQLHRREKSA